MSYFKRSIIIILLFCIAYFLTQMSVHKTGGSPIHILTGITFACAAVFGLKYLPVIFLSVLTISSSIISTEWPFHAALLSIAHVGLYGISGYRFGIGWHGRFSQYSAVSLFAVGLGTSFLYAIVLHNFIIAELLTADGVGIGPFLSNWIGDFSAMMIMVPLIMTIHNYLATENRPNLSAIFNNFKGSTQISLLISGIVLAAIFSVFPPITNYAPYILTVVLIPILLISLSYGVFNGLVASLITGATLMIFSKFTGAVVFSSPEIHFLIALAASISLIAGGSRNDRVAALNRAEIANQAKTDFLSSMSHELRTPMNAILGFAQLLENNPKEQLSKVQKDHTRQILKGGAHLLELIDNVLELSKIEAGKTALSIESVAPGPVIDDCLSMVETQSKDNNIQLNYTPGKDDLPLLRTDRNRFKQVLLNLLSNAIKYNRNGGSVTMTTELAADNFLRINIADTGLGIPIEKQYGLFEPFNRLGREAGEIEGTGIGLTITKQVMELLGGRIGFNSTPDVGSTFWIELPVSENQSIELTDTDAVMADISHNEDHFRSSVILYIEDNPANLELMKAIIERFANLKLESAHTAELGLVVAKDIQPDLILMDINLPGMDGIAALNRLRMDDRTKDIPVIAVSAGVMPNEIERGMAAGFEDFIAKPINVPQVVDAIGKHIEQN